MCDILEFAQYGSISLLICTALNPFRYGRLMFLALVGLKLFLAWVVALSLRFTVVVQLQISSVPDWVEISRKTFTVEFLGP